MPAGEIIGEIVGEIILRPIITIIAYVFGSLGYFTGAAFLTIVTFGRLELAPLESLFGEGCFRKRPDIFSMILWMEQPGKRRALKAGWVCFTGIFLWIVIGLGTYQVLKGRNLSSESNSQAVLESKLRGPDHLCDCFRCPVRFSSRG